MPHGSLTANSVPFFAQKQPQQVLEAGSRIDGRSFEEFRAVCESLPILASMLTRQADAWDPFCAVLNTGAISQAAGSAYAEFNNTKVMAAV